MSHLLEWSRAYTHRLNPVDAAPFAARAPELAQRLAEETAAGRLPFLNMPYRAALEKEMAPLLPRIKGYRHMLLLSVSYTHLTLPTTLTG